MATLSADHRPVLAVVHQAHSDPGLVGLLLGRQGIPVERCCPALGDSLPPPGRYRAVVVFGGPMSANDDTTLPFIAAELRWIETLLATDTPYLGLCLGAQMLARVLGAQVAPHPEGLREAGYYPIYRASAAPEQPPLFPSTMQVYQWHQEGFSLPPHSRLLATGQTFTHQAFVAGRAYGLQFHPEITAPLMRRWITDGADQLSFPGTQPSATHLHQHQHYGPVVNHWLQGFLHHWLRDA